jgi:large subunit ribosomal protein L23
VKDKHNIIIRPVVSEKSHRLMENAGGRKLTGKVPARQYTFEVHSDANKVEIRKAVEGLFGVKVLDVNTQRIKPKPRRVGVHSGYTRRWKKAVIRLAAGQTIEIY